MRTVELCGACAHLLEESGCKVKKIAGGVNQKVRCEHCGRRRYGGTFRIEIKTPVE